MLLALGFVVAQSGPLLVGLVGVVVLLGRFWWPADVFRQVAWRVLEPTGLLKRVDRVEDHSTRRVARVLGGGLLLASGMLLAAEATWAWAIVAAIGLMIFLDAAFDFCVLCELTYVYGRLRGSPGAAH